ncbi:MAG: putative PEP-binding protein [Turneriella sp.]
MRHIRAKSIYPGRIRGVMMEYRRERFAVEEKSSVNPRSEYRQFKSALKSAQQQLNSERKMMLDRRKQSPGEILAIDDAIHVLESHLMTLEDPYFLGEIKNRIFNTGATAAASLGVVISMVSRQFSFDAPRSALDGKRQNSHFLKDMSDMKRRILFFLGLQQELHLPDGISIVAAQKLTVSEVLALKRAGVRGIVIGQTSETAHELVMLRAMRIPCVSVSDARFFRLKRQVPVLLDADIGYIVMNPRRTARFIQSGDPEAVQRWSLSARMRSGERSELSGTLHFVSEIRNLPAGTVKERIGLYRTEYQVSEAHEMPSTRQLTKQYEYLLGEHPELDVTFRLFDFSDDKNFLKNAAIENDRDLRGMRFLLHERKMLESQLTALFKAAHETNRPVKLLLPYLSEYNELKQVRQMIASLSTGKRKIRFSLGGMLENTAAVFGARRWSTLLDFFYVGTSDLLSAISQQRRENTEAIHRALLSDAFAVLARELKVLSRLKPLSICGEIAGEPWAIAYLASFGFRDYVLPTHRIPIAQNMLQAMSRSDAVQYAKLIMRLDDETQRLETARSLALEILYGQS